MSPLFNRMRNEFIQQFGTDPFTDTRSGYSILMLNPEILAWGMTVLVDRNDPYTMKYLVFEKANGELIIVPLIPNFSPIDVANFWLEEK